MVTSVAIALSLAVSAVAARSPSAQGHSDASSSSSWSGWKHVKQLFVFGDSYSSTGFDYKGTQPNDANPLGNPKYPGLTSAGGANYVGFLTTTYNASRLLTYNLAYGGATVDSALVPPYLHTVRSLKDQVHTEFLHTYGSTKSRSTTPWSSTTSLFTFFFGVNDVGRSWMLNKPQLNDQIFAEYAELLEEVYAAGARNFLFLNTPPVHLAPLTTRIHDGGKSIYTEWMAIVEWNKRLDRMARDLKRKHKDTAVFVHDTYKVFHDIIKKPKDFMPTVGLKDTTTYCKAYGHGTPTRYTKDASCKYAVNEYFWLNNLHPTFPVHDALAASIAMLLKKKPTY